VSSLSITLGYGNMIEVLFQAEEGSEILLKGLDVGFGPLNLSSWPIQWMHKAHYTPSLAGQSGTVSVGNSFSTTANGDSVQRAPSFQAGECALRR
jgi:hypothetical protein